MAEVTKKLTRKEKIAAGIEKAPKRKKAYAAKLKDAREDLIKAKLRNSPIATRKMRLVVDLIRGMEVDKALNTLSVTSKAGAEPVRKLILSALANYEDKTSGNVDEGSLYVKEAWVDGGRQLKRFRPAPQGRAHRIRKRSNHVTVILDTKEELN